MIKYPNLIPECNVDTAFVEMLGYKEPNHAPDIATVASTLFKNKLNEAAIGFIDNDKKKPGYVREFKAHSKANKVSLLKHPDRVHYLVVVDPAMDRFIYDLCVRLKIDLGKYKLPGDFDGFLAATKKTAIKNSLDFKNLLNTIWQKQPEEVVTVKSWIRKFSGYKN